METKKDDFEIIVYENNGEAADNMGLRSFNKLCKILGSKNICIKRYSFVKDREQFRQNNDLWHLICCAGIDILPATYVNGKIEKIEEYPTKKEIYRWISDV
ncbi:arsenic metallochaperone ArsD family protein [Mahella sp.]|uniref:arsenic metallochaperone ArsD family protein n=1 Tax=Mahella sp. TaxID=2798721 RepID=UPI0025B9659A|nr:arsenic metallochaperone ArsD family protein [Mahella sp.]MBZ4666604.1 Arsenical resistance operon trans-acting repressor ArsD [Mahella sp.]